MSESRHIGTVAEARANLLEAAAVLPVGALASQLDALILAAQEPYKRALAEATEALEGEYKPTRKMRRALVTIAALKGKESHELQGND